MELPRGTKKNAKKGIAAMARTRKRVEAEDRNDRFQKLSAAEKQERNTGKAKNKYVA